jgi:hypothetical protein
MDEYEARRATVVLLSAFVVLAVALGAMVAKGDDDKDDERADVDTEQETTTSTTARPTSTSDGGASSSTSSSVAASGGSSTSVARASTSTTKPKPSTTTTVGRDELAEPGCASGGGGAPEGPGADWASRWQTMPQPNDPATITICIDDITPKVGQVVTLTLVGDDPDAVITQAECGWVIDWEGNLASLCRDALVPTLAPRPTPPETRGHVLIRETHVYETPGQRKIDASVTSAEWHGYRDAYSSFAATQLTVDVHA